jgi:hypothetical protein
MDKNKRETKTEGKKQMKKEEENQMKEERKKYWNGTERER